MDDRHHLRVAREVQVGRRLHEARVPHVCELLDTYEDETEIFLVLERCEGGDVFQLQHDNGGCLAEEYVATDIVMPLLRALTHLHSLDWMHRDIKPENCFLTADAGFKLGDFGLSINHCDEHAFHISGTLDYLAPEMLRNPTTEHEEGAVSLRQLREEEVTPYGPSIDVWAVGIIAYELVTGAAPFRLDDEQDTMHLIMHCDDVHYPERFSRQWADFVRLALRKDPAQRPSARTMLEHPWVRQNLALRPEVPEPRPPRTVLRAEEVPVIAEEPTRLDVVASAEFDEDVAGGAGMPFSPSAQLRAQLKNNKMFDTMDTHGLD